MSSGALAGYCIRATGEVPPSPELTGIGGAPVRCVEAAGLAIWLSDEVAGPATVDRMRAHDAVVRAAMRSATPLPLRYGARFASESEARDLLQSRAAEFAASLTRVAGCVEAGMRVLWKTPPISPPHALAAPPTSGRVYLEMRRDALQLDEQARADATALLDRLDRHFPGIPAERRLGSEPGVVGSVAHLVQGSALAAYRALVQSAREDLREVDLVLTGPWAPYSFV